VQGAWLAVRSLRTEIANRKIRVRVQSRDIPRRFCDKHSCVSLVASAGLDPMARLSGYAGLHAVCF
jgi:hypothetical protein